MYHLPTRDVPDPWLTRLWNVACGQKIGRANDLRRRRPGCDKREVRRAVEQARYTQCDVMVCLMAGHDVQFAVSVLRDRLLPVMRSRRSLPAGSLHGSTSASAQGVDLNFPNPLLDSFRSSKRLPPPTRPVSCRPAVHGRLGLRASANRCARAFKVRQGRVGERQATPSGLEGKSAKYPGTRSAGHQNPKARFGEFTAPIIREFGPILIEWFSRTPGRHSGFQTLIFQNADLELWAHEALTRLDHRAIEGYVYPPFVECDRAQLPDTGPAAPRAAAPDSALPANVSIGSQEDVCTFEAAGTAAAIVMPPATGATVRAPAGPPTSVAGLPSGDAPIADEKPGSTRSRRRRRTRSPPRRQRALLHDRPALRLPRVRHLPPPAMPPGLRQFLPERFFGLSEAQDFS